MISYITLLKMLIDCIIFLATYMFFGAVEQRRLSLANELFSAHSGQLYSYISEVKIKRDSRELGLSSLFHLCDN